MTTRNLRLLILVVGFPIVVLAPVRVAPGQKPPQTARKQKEQAEGFWPQWRGPYAAALQAPAAPGPAERVCLPVGADGRVYITGREGTTLVIRHGTKFEVLATNHLEDEFEASPALVGDEIYLRGNSYLYCIAETVPKSPAPRGGAQRVPTC